MPNVGVGGSLVLKTAGFLDGMIRKSIGFVLTSVFVRGILLLKLAKANYIKERKSMTLNELKTGASGTITVVHGDGALRCRLLDMGLIPHTHVTLQKVAPMGDPIEIRVRGYELTLRVEEAEKIEVEVDGTGFLRLSATRTAERRRCSTRSPARISTWAIFRA